MLRRNLMANHKKTCVWSGTFTAPSAPSSGTYTIRMDYESVNGSIPLTNTRVLYVAGDFRNTSNQRIVAKYDGSWHNLGTGPSAARFNGRINDLATNIFGILYAVGAFTNRVAIYDGTNWHSIQNIPCNNYNNAPAHTVNVLTRGDIYVAGESTDSVNKHVIIKYGPIYPASLGALPDWTSGSCERLTFYPTGNVMASTTHVESSKKYIYLVGEGKWSGKYIIDKFSGVRSSDHSQIQGPGFSNSITNIGVASNGRIYIGSSRIAGRTSSIF